MSDERPTIGRAEAVRRTGATVQWLEQVYTDDDDPRLTKNKGRERQGGVGRERGYYLDELKAMFPAMDVSGLEPPPEPAPPPPPPPPPFSVSAADLQTLWSLSPTDYNDQVKAYAAADPRAAEWFKKHPPPVSSNAAGKGSASTRHSPPPPPRPSARLSRIGTSTSPGGKVVIACCVACVAGLVALAANLQNASAPVSVSRVVATASPTNLSAAPPTPPPQACDAGDYHPKQWVWDPVTCTRKALPPVAEPTTPAYLRAYQCEPPPYDHEKFFFYTSDCALHPKWRGVQTDETISAAQSASPIRHQPARR